MTWKVRVLNKQDKWRVIGPPHDTVEDAERWIEENRKESWINTSLLEEEQGWAPRRGRFLKEDEYAFRVEVFYERKWEKVGELHDNYDDAVDWAKSNRCDWWEDWQAVEAQPDDRVRFMRKWLPEPNSGCWLWTGGTDGEYGSFSYQGIVMGAHRASWLILKGEIPKGMVVRHRCDNPVCVNPSHLLLGTQLQNMQDARERGRVSRGERHSASLKGKQHPTAQGSNHFKSSLKDRDVIEIREMASKGFPHKELAKKFSTSVYNIRAIVYRKSWKHL